MINNCDTYLFVVPWDIKHAGGVNQVVINMARYFIKKSIYKVIILVVDWDAIAPVYSEYLGIQVVRWRVMSLKSNMNFKEKISYFLWERLFYYRFNNFCICNSIKIINFHYPNPVAFSLKNIVDKIRHNIFFIFSFHGSDIKYLSKIKKDDIIYYNKFFNKFCAIVTCSIDLKNQVLSTFHSLNNIHVAYNGIDTDKFMNFSGNSKFNLPKKYILSVSNFIERKGLDILIKAYNLFLQKNEEYDLVIVGAPGESFEKMQMLRAQLKLSSKVHFYTDINNDSIYSFYENASAFVLSSRGEAFPLVLLEAALFSLPVISTNVGGVVELIENNISGIIIDVEDINALQLSMIKIFENISFKNDISSNLNSKVSKYFTLDNSVSCYLQIIKNYFSGK